MARHRKKKTKKPFVSSSLSTEKSTGADPDLNDEVDEFHNQRDTIALGRVRFAKGADDGDDNEEEVLSVGPKGDEYDDEEFMDGQESDFSDSDEDTAGKADTAEDYLPGADAWGKKRRAFYNTDYVDEDYGGFSGSDAEDAELEEEEALALQRNVAAKLTESDFQIDLPASNIVMQMQDSDVAKGNIDTGGSDEDNKPDVARMSQKERLQHLRRHCPELRALIDDFNTKQRIITEQLQPLMDYIQTEAASATSTLKTANLPIFSEIKVVFEAYSGYLLNILFYVYLVGESGIENISSVKEHPVIDRITEWKKLTLSADRVFGELEPHIQILRSALKSNRNLLELLPKVSMTHSESKSRKRSRAAEFDDDGDYDFLSQNGDGSRLDGEKRPINKEIAKNQGLLPKRRKDLKHSRVKKRKNYDKALIRRRGQIPDVKREMSRYGGEARGINIGVVKSRKLH